MSLFFGIMVHKSLVMYSAGMNLMAKFANSKIKMFTFVAILALITPAGAIVGYVVEVIL
jgi:zinc transporter ZupT